jgi:hypothetical protein
MLNSTSRLRRVPRTVLYWYVVNVPYMYGTVENLSVRLVSAGLLMNGRIDLRSGHSRL